MENKPTVEELLRQQLELLAERSQKSLTDELPQLTHAMVEVYGALKSETSSRRYQVIPE